MHVVITWALPLRVCVRDEGEFGPGSLTGLDFEVSDLCGRYWMCVKQVSDDLNVHSLRLKMSTDCGQTS